MDHLYPGYSLCKYVRTRRFCTGAHHLATAWRLFHAPHSIFCFARFPYCRLEMGIDRWYYFYPDWSGIKSIYLHTQSYPKPLHCWGEPWRSNDDNLSICGYRNTIYYQSFPEEKGTSENAESITGNRFISGCLLPELFQCNENQWHSTKSPMSNLEVTDWMTKIPPIT